MQLASLDEEERGADTRFKTDHKIHLKLDFNSFKYEPGYSIFKNKYLEDVKFTSELHSNFRFKVNKYLETPFNLKLTL